MCFAFYTNFRESEIASIVERADRLILFSTLFALFLGGLIAVVITGIIVKPLAKIVGVMKELAAGNLDQELITRRTDEMGVLMTTTNAMIQSLQQLIGRLGSGITQLASASEEMSAVAQENTRIITDQKNETDQVATAMNEMTATASEETLQSNQELSRLGVELQQLAGQFKLKSA